MKIWTLLTLSILAFTYTSAQDQAKIDSLTQELSSSADTSKVKILVELSNLLKFDNPEEAIKYASQSLEESQSLKYKKGIGNSYNILGIIHAIRNNYPKALEYFLKFLAISKEINNQTDIANALGNIANIYHLEKDQENALLFFEKALKIKSDLPDKAAEMSGLNSLGLAYTDYGLYEKSEACFNEIIELAQLEQHEAWLATAYNQLGRNANLKGDHQKALEYYTEAVALNQQYDRKKPEAIATSNIGEVYKNMQNYDKAIEFYAKSLDIRKEIGYHYGVAITTLKIAETYQAQSKVKESNIYALQSLEMAENLGVNEFIRDALQTLSVNHFKQNDFKKAYDYQQKYIAVSDSILNQEKISQLAEMQTRFDLETKEQQIATQQAEILLFEQKELADKNLRYALMGGGLLLLLLIVFIYSRYRIKQQAEKALQVKNQEVEAKNEEIRVINEELEKRMLRAQMDPHFIFNSLNSIQHFITINDKDSALPYLSKFSKLIRQVLENSVNQQVPIADEIKLLEYYVQLEALRFHNKFDYAINVGEGLDIYDHEVPFLLIQPYVENSIVHGIRYLETPGRLNVELNKSNGHILCVVEDNGIGRVQAQAKKANDTNHVSHGMPITSKRLELLNKGKKHKTLVSVTDLYDESDNPKGTRVEIQIPINTI